MNLRFCMLFTDKKISSTNHCIIITFAKCYFLCSWDIFHFCIICVLSLTMVLCPKTCGTWLVQQLVIGKQSNINNAKSVSTNCLAIMRMLHKSWLVNGLPIILISAMVPAGCKMCLCKH